MRIFGQLFIDLIAVAIATVGAFLLRDDLALSAASAKALLPYLSLTLAVAAVVLVAGQLNRAIWRMTSIHDALVTALCVAAIVLATMALDFFLRRLDGVARSLPIIHGGLMLSLLLALRLMARLRHLRPRKSPFGPAGLPIGSADHAVLIVGVNDTTRMFLELLAPESKSGGMVAGLLATKRRLVGRRVGSHKVIGMADDALTVVRDLKVHGVNVTRILVSCPSGQLTTAGREQLARAEREAGIKVDRIEDFVGALARPATAAAAITEPALATSADARSGPAFDASTPSSSPGGVPAFGTLTYWTMKRGLDIAMAATLLLLVTPLQVLIAAAIAVETRGWPVFWQLRLGRAGTPFLVYKFKTMGAAFDAGGRSLSDGERLGPVGRFLRATRLDELPQLFNVLVGHMSFVGPRPLLLRDQPANPTGRLLVRPGLTGWAQVNGGRLVDAEAKARLDEWYIANASLALDLEIMVATVRIVLRGDSVALAERFSDKVQPSL